MFFVLATTGVLLLLVMYAAVTDLAAVRRLRRSGAGVGATLLPLGGAAVAAIVLVQGLRSAPAGLALVVTGWLILSAAFGTRRGAPRGTSPTR